MSTSKRKLYIVFFDLPANILPDAGELVFRDIDFEDFKEILYSHESFIYGPDWNYDFLDQYLNTTGVSLTKNLRLIRNKEVTLTPNELVIVIMKKFDSKSGKFHYEYKLMSIKRE